MNGSYERQSAYISRPETVGDFNKELEVLIRSIEANTGVSFKKYPQIKIGTYEDYQTYYLGENNEKNSETDNLGLSYSDYRNIAVLYTGAVIIDNSKNEIMVSSKNPNSLSLYDLSVNLIQFLQYENMDANALKKSRRTDIEGQLIKRVLLNGQQDRISFNVFLDLGSSIDKTSYYHETTEIQPDTLFSQIFKYAFERQMTRKLGKEMNLEIRNGYNGEKASVQNMFRNVSKAYNEFDELSKLDMIVLNAFLKSKLLRKAAYNFHGLFENAGITFIDALNDYPSKFYEFGIMNLCKKSDDIGQVLK